MTDRRYVVLVCLVAGCIPQCLASVPNLTALPGPTKPYNAAGSSYDDAGLSPLFDFARSFINTALPAFPKDLISDYMNDKITLNVDFAKDLVLKRFLGYGIAIVVGILFAVLFPLVGCCFCCCRMCGKCGGSRKQEEDDGLHCHRRVFTGIVFVVVVFTMTGNICTYVTNDRMSLALNKIEDTVVNNFDDFDTFLDMLSKQVHVVADDNLKVTKQAILQHIGASTLKDEISQVILSKLSNGSFDKMQQHMDDLQATFKDVNDKKAAVDNAFAAAPGNPLAAIDLTSMSSGVSTFLTGSPIQKAKNDIKTAITTSLNGANLTGIQTTVTDSFDQMSAEIAEFITMVDDIKNKSKDSGFDLEGYKCKVKAYTSTAKKYDQYRSYAGLGLAGITTLIVALQTFGLVFGFFGQGTSTRPTERSCVSNSGGNFLIASVAFIFLFSSLLMILTTISFSVGSVLERFVCQPLTDLSFLEIVEDKISSLPRKPIDIINDCKAGRAAYTAFGLETQFNLSKMDDQLASTKQSIKGDMSIKLHGLTSGFTTSFNSAQIKAPLTALGTSLANVDSLITAVDGLLGASPIPVAPLQRSALTAFRASLVRLQTLRDSMNGVNGGQTWAQEFQAGLTRVTNSITGGTMQTIVDDYVDSIIKIAEDYVEYVKDTLKKELGRCDPMWNLYNSVVLIAFCKYTVDAFNGFWFSIGWCIFFFVPGVVFAVKLSKHFRTMNPDDEESQFHLRPPRHSGKVAPSHD